MFGVEGGGGGGACRPVSMLGVGGGAWRGGV